MRKFLLLLALMCVAMAHAGTDNLRVSLTNGQKVLFAFSAAPEISFVDDVLQIVSTEASAPVQYEISNVSSIDFVDSSGLKDVELLGVAIHSTGSAIVFSNLPEACPVAVYSIDGRLVLNDVASLEYTLDRSSLNHGIYVVQIGNFVTKISL